MTADSNLPRVSVVIPTHNPREDYLARVLGALLQQTLPREQWEIIVIDNGSCVPLRAGAGPRDQETKSLKDQKTQGPQATEIDLSWHPQARVVREEMLGLTFARLRGFAESKGELIVMVDDDNLLAPDYLETAVRIAEKHPMLGAFGGKSLPEFEVEPPEWLQARGKGLGLRDRGEREEFFPEAAIAESWQLADGSWHGGENGKPPAESARQVAQRPTDTDHRQRRAVREFPECSPIGAGMVLRSSAARAYAERLQARGERQGARGEETITDRKGDSLASGGDNDICLTVVEEGWQVGYTPQLQLTHLIPARRMTLNYHQRMARDSMKSFILMLDQHGIRPWAAMAKWTLPLRVANDWLRVRPWQGPEQSLRFWGHVGMYEGRAALRA
jgi:hypothetical protein